jgi:hypothetical protein
MRERAILAICAVAVVTVATRSPAAELRSECRVTELVHAEPPRDRNADPFGPGPWYAHADRTMWAGADAPRMAVTPKGRYNKVLWIRAAGSELKVSGRRLDAEAPPLTAYIPCCYPTGFQASGLAFPSEGCWEIKAVAGANELTFVTRVAPLARRR